MSGRGSTGTRPFLLAPCMLRVAVKSAVRARQTDCPVIRAPLRDRSIARVLAPLLPTEPEQLPATPELRRGARIGKAGPSIGKAGPRVEGSSQMKETPTYYAGIDVAKDRLDVVLRPSGEYVEATNDERGIRSVVRRLRKEEVALWRYSKPPGGSSSPPRRLSLSPGYRWRSSTPGRSGTYAAWAQGGQVPREPRRWVAGSWSPYASPCGVRLSGFSGPPLPLIHQTS